MKAAEGYTRRAIGNARENSIQYLLLKNHSCLTHKQHVGKAPRRKNSNPIKFLHKKTPQFLLQRATEILLVQVLKDRWQL